MNVVFVHRPCKSPHLVCVALGPGYSTPPSPPLSYSSSVLQLSTSHSLILWPCWIHLLLLFASDNWLEQWNACVSPSPLNKRLCLFSGGSVCAPSFFSFLTHLICQSLSLPLFLSPSFSISLFSKFLTLLVTHVSAFMNECNARDSLLE